MLDCVNKRMSCPVDQDSLICLGEGLRMLSPASLLFSGWAGAVEGDYICVKGHFSLHSACLYCVKVYAW